MSEADTAGSCPEDIEAAARRAYGVYQNFAVGGPYAAWDDLEPYQRTLAIGMTKAALGIEFTNEDTAHLLDARRTAFGSAG